MKQKLLANLILLCIAVAVCLVLLEVIVRISGAAAIYGYPDGLYQNDDLLDYKLVPGASGELIKPEFTTSFAINSLGMNDYEYPEETAQDYRILALGDSFVWGAYGTELDEHFLKILEKELNERSEGKHFQVLKAGVPGYGTDQELLYLKNEGIKLKPDMVLLHFYTNDFDDNMVSGERGANEKGQLVTKREKKQNVLVTVRNFLFNYLHSYRLMERTAVNIIGPKLGSLVGGDTIYNTNELSNVYEKIYSDAALAKVGKTFELIEEMDQFARENNVPLVVILIPAKFQVYANLQEDIMKENQHMQYDFEKPNKMFTAWAGKRNIPVIDLLPGFKAHDQNKDLYWTLNPHWNKAGNQKAAELLYKDLIKHRAVADSLQPN